MYYRGSDYYLLVLLVTELEAFSAVAIIANGSR